MTADAAAREIITRAGLDRTLFVEAGAGTGKTTQLVGRIASLVIDKGVRMAGIAAITFTEAAAAELSARIRVAFKRGAADSADEEVRARCRQAIEDADRAAISTLHSFASRILGEHTLDAGLPPASGSSTRSAPSWPTRSGGAASSTSSTPTSRTRSSSSGRCWPTPPSSPATAARPP